MLVPPGDADALAAAIESLANSKARQDYADKAREIALSVFSRDKILGNLTELLL